jgi:hypothetical protein
MLITSARNGLWETVAGCGEMAGWWRWRDARSSAPPVSPLGRETCTEGRFIWVRHVTFFVLCNTRDSSIFHIRSDLKKRMYTRSPWVRNIDFLPRALPWARNSRSQVEISEIDAGGRTLVTSLVLHASVRRQGSEKSKNYLVALLCSRMLSRYIGQEAWFGSKKSILHTL